MLTERLARLEAAGIVGKRDDPADARRYRYFLTEKGIDLAPMLVEMVLWSARHEHTDAPPPVLRRMRTQKARFLAEVRRSWRRDTPHPTG